MLRRANNKKEDIPMKKILTLALALVLVMSCFAAMAEDQMYISVISKGEQHAFWQQVRKGCEAAASDYGVDLYYYGPPSESDIALQIEALNSELQKNPNAICLAALDAESVVAQCAEALSKGIPIVGFDSGVPGAPEGSVVSTVATDNYVAAGAVAEKFMEQEGFADLLASGTPDKPIVIGVLCQDANSLSVAYRTSGFADRMSELAGEYNTVSVEGHDKWANPVADAGVIIQISVGATAEMTDMTNAASALLNTEGLVAVFCSNEGAVNAFLAATSSGSDLADGGVYGDLIVAGFDAGANQKNAVRQNWFIGSVSQDPYKIGYKSVENAVKAAKGEAVEDIDTGFHWYTSENIDDDDIAPLVYD